MKKCTIIILLILVLTCSLFADKYKVEVDAINKLIFENDYSKIETRLDYYTNILEDLTEDAELLEWQVYILHAQVLYYLANLTAGMDKIEEGKQYIEMAKKSGEHALRLNKNNADVNRIVCDIYGRYISIFKDGSKVSLGSKMIPLINRAVKLDPKNYKCYLTRASVYIYTPYKWGGDLEKAKLDIDKAGSLCGWNDETYIMQGIYYLTINKKKEALTSFKKAYKFNPNNFYAFYLVESNSPGYLKQFQGYKIANIKITIDMTHKNVIKQILKMIKLKKGLTFSPSLFNESIDILKKEFSTVRYSIHKNDGGVFINFIIKSGKGMHVKEEGVFAPSFNIQGTTSFIPGIYTNLYFKDIAMTGIDIDIYMIGMKLGVDFKKWFGPFYLGLNNEGEIWFGGDTIYTNHILNNEYYGFNEKVVGKLGVDIKYFKADLEGGFYIGWYFQPNANTEINVFDPLTYTYRNDMYVPLKLSLWAGFKYFGNETVVDASFIKNNVKLYNCSKGKIPMGTLKKNIGYINVGLNMGWAFNYSLNNSDRKNGFRIGGGALAEVDKSNFILRGALPLEYYSDRFILGKIDLRFNVHKKFAFSIGGDFFGYLNLVNNNPMFQFGVETRFYLDFLPFMPIEVFVQSAPIDGSFCAGVMLKFNPI